MSAETLLTLCHRVFPEDGHRVQCSKSSVKSDCVTVIFQDGTQTETTAINACRALIGDRKYDPKAKLWSPLSPYEFGLCETMLQLDMAETSTCPKPKLVAHILERLQDSSERFLVDKSALTLADVVVFFSLQKVTPSMLDKRLCDWMRFFQSHAAHPLVPPPTSVAERKKGSGSTTKENDLTQSNEGASTLGEGATLPAGTNFIKQIIEDDLKSGKHKSIITRFPPEPNGFLHLGHAKSICLNFGLARTYGGRCHLRFDDTNPTKEDMRYINSIQEDVKWLGGDWGEHLYFTSDYFQQLYDWAVQLIKQGDAYVDHQTDDEVKANRGDVTHPGVNSPYRDRSVEENLELFERMRRGEFPEGTCILRAKIDMAHGNMNMRDPPIYRIRFHPHPRTGDTWKVYPIYDFAHGQSDSIEHITHSICTLEFEDHRPLYDWFQEKLNIFRTRQIEFARLNCTYVVMSKRKLNTLVVEKYVKDWDDPRLPTVSGMRRRGYPAVAIRDFCDRIGVAKRDTVIGYEYLTACVMNALHPVALRRNVVVHPLRVTVSNLGEDEVIELEFPNHPENPELGTRKGHFSRTVYIDETDFNVDPPPQYFRLAPGREVRLRYGFWIKCHDYKTDAAGKVTEVICTYDPDTRGGNAPPDGRKVKGTLHWVSEKDACDLDLYMYDHLFTTPSPDNVPEGKVWQDFINPDSLKICRGKGESCLRTVVHPYYDGGYPVQFERTGFFVADYDSTPEQPIFNLTIPLTDSWAAMADEASKAAQNKEAQRLAREKAALDRQKKKEEREKRAAQKKQIRATECS